MPSKKKNPVMMKAHSVAGTKYLFDCFISNRKIPVYEVFSIHGLNQLIGYAKFINREYGNVYYRGQGKLYPSLLPVLLRTVLEKERGQNYKWVPAKLTRVSNLFRVVNKVMVSKELGKDLKVDSELGYVSKYVVAGLLQHYGVPTIGIDLVDNHWVALWMGLHTLEQVDLKKGGVYYHYIKRERSLVELCSDEEQLYQYILILAFPKPSKSIEDISYSDSAIVIDLRKTLSSVFLRPHAQHGIVAFKNMECC